MKSTLLLTAVLSSAATLFGSAATTTSPLPSVSQGEGIQFPQASPPAMVRDQVGLTTVEIEYARPHARGRKVFGGLVPYGEIWRTGANAATRVTFSTDVSFGGTDVPAGTYGLFTIPGEKEWTVILNSGAEQWGAYGYDESLDVARVQVAPTMAKDSVDSLTLGLTSIMGDTGHLELAWESTRVAVPIRTNLVEELGPRILAFMDSDAEQKPYLPAAMFFYEHDLDVKKALEWIESARVAQPTAPWVVYRKALIQAKAGDKRGAMGSAEAAMKLAEEAGGRLGAEYKGLCEALMRRLKN